jgi:predicted PurR-regulated permease PerM
LSLKDQVIGVLKEIDGVLNGFIRGQLLVALILAGLYSLGLTLCQVPMGLLIGVIAGMLAIIPYLGLIIGILPALLLSFLQYRTWEPILLVLAVFAVVQVLEGTIITPRIVGNKIGLHPVVVMIVVLLGGTFFGFFGILLAVPVGAVTNVFVKLGLRRYKESQFFHGE